MTEVLWTVEEDDDDDTDDDDDDDTEKKEKKTRGGSCHVHIVLPKSCGGLTDEAWRGLFEVRHTVTAVRYRHAKRESEAKRVRLLE